MFIFTDGEGNEMLITDSDQQIPVELVQRLIDLRKKICQLAGASTGPVAEEIFDALDSFCLHDPCCEKGDICRYDVEGEQERRKREGEVDAAEEETHP